MAFNIPIPSHSHLFNSHSLPSPFPIFDLFPFPWDSRVGHSHSLPFPFPILCFIPIPMGFPWDSRSHCESRSHAHLYSAVHKRNPVCSHRSDFAPNSSRPFIYRFQNVYYGGKFRRTNAGKLDTVAKRVCVKVTRLRLVFRGVPIGAAIFRGSTARKHRHRHISS